MDIESIISNFGGLDSVFDKPEFLLLIIPIFFVLLFLIRKDFVSVRDQEGKKVKRTSSKIVIFFTRLVLFSLLIMALASPYIEKEKTTKGDPYLKIY